MPDAGEDILGYGTAVPAGAVMVALELAVCRRVVDVAATDLLRSPGRAQHRRRCDDAAVTDDADAAQARELLQSLHAHVDEISKKVESAENRTRRVQGHAAVVARRRVASLRHELYEAHGLIDRLHRRFPETRPERLRSGGCTDRRQIGR
jgi:hypothetical protein